MPDGPNPYAVTADATVEPLHESWPPIPRRDARRLLQLLTDGRRARLSLVMLLVLGGIGPFIGFIFFWGHRHSFDRLMRRYPELLNEQGSATDRQWEDLHRARSQFQYWRRIHMGLSIVLVFVCFLIIVNELKR